MDRLVLGKTLAVLPQKNYRPDDDSSKVETPGGSLKQVKDVVNSKAVSGDQAIPQLTTGIPDGQPNPGPNMKYHPEEVETEGEEISEEEVEETAEVVSEEQVEAGEDFSIEEDVKRTSRRRRTLRRVPRKSTYYL